MKMIIRNIRYSQQKIFDDLVEIVEIKGGYAITHRAGHTETININESEIVKITQ